jgi:uncharacterized protein
VSWRTSAASVVCGSVLLGLLLTGVLATQPSGEFLATVQPQRELGYVSMPDGARLPYVLYGQQLDRRSPVLLIYNPYEGGGTDGAAPGPLGQEIRDYLQHGYVVVAASLRGTGCSAGTLTFQSPQIAEDGAALVEWAGAQRWSDGNVGMFGNSFSGMTTLMVGGRRPAPLRAIISGAPPSRLYEDIFYPGGIFSVGQAGLWSFAGQPFSALRGVEFREAAGDRECASLRAAQRPNRMVHEQSEHPLYDEWWQTRSIEHDAARLRVPVLFVHAWQDQQIAVSSGLQLFRRTTTMKKIVLSNGGHSFYNQSGLQETKRRWFDRWLRQAPNGIEEEPAVTVLFENRMQNGQQAGWTATYPAWPVPGTRQVSLALLPDGSLAPSADSPSRSGERSYIYPVSTELVGTQTSFAVRPHPQGTLRYLSAPMTDDMTLLGAPSLTMYLSSEQSDTDLMAVLYDVSPAGETVYLQRGFARASHRSLNANPAASEFYHDHSRRLPLVPGEVHELVVPFYAVGHVLRRAHRLELAILAPPAIPSPNWALALILKPSRNTVHYSARYGSRLDLPVIPGGASAVVPPCGSLEFQPCRSRSQ